jgi:hypothetical protein
VIAVRGMSVLLIGGALSLTPRVAREAAAHSGASVAHAHRRSINFVDYGGFRLGAPPENAVPVPIFRGATADMVVHGTFLDVSTGVEVRTPGNQSAAGITASVTNAVGGDDTHVTLHLSSTSAAAFGKYLVLFHYAIEVRGADTLRIELFDRGTVNAASISSPAPRADGSYLVGENLTLHLQGTGLSHAALLPQPQRGLVVVQTVSRSSSDATFVVRFDSSGVASFRGTTSVFDGQQGEGPYPGCSVACYAGSTQTSFVLRILPRATSVPSGAVATGTTVTLGGVRIAPKGYSAFVDFVAKYRTSARGGDVVSVSATASGSGLQFSAPAKDISADSGTLRYVIGSGPRDSLAATSVSMPPLNLTGFSPNIMRIDSIGVAGARRPMIRAGDQQAFGFDLFPDPTFVVRTATSITQAGSVTLVTLPTIAFGGSAATVQSAGYRSTSTRIIGMIGADSVVFTIPNGGAFGDTMTRSLTISTASGSQTIQNVVFVPPPSVNELRTFNASGVEVSLPFTGSTLVRGKQYRLRGKGLVIQTSGSTPELARVTVGGVAATVALAPSPNLDAVFTVPAGATSGALNVTTAGGTLSVGSFAVTDPVASLAIAGLSLSPTSIAGGRPITATVAINGTVPAGGSAGNIAFTLATPSDAVVPPTGLIAVTANPMVVTIPTRAVKTQQTVSIRVSGDPNATAIVQQIASVTLTPPIPTSLILTPTSTSGGASVRGVVHMNTTATSAEGIPVTLVNSDPTTATAPPSVIMSGDSAVFTVGAAIVPADRPVTITASSGGQSQSATLTVRAPTLTKVDVQPASIIPGATTATATLTLSGAVGTPTSMTVVCNAALTCPPTVTVNSGQSSATFAVTAHPVPSSLNAPVDVTLNGQTTHAALTLTPLAIQTLTMSPASVQAGVKSSLTIQLNSAVPAGQSVDISFASNSANVTAPATVTLVQGTIAKLVPILTQAPLSQTSTVTITATLSQTTSTTANNSTKSATITVTP